MYCVYPPTTFVLRPLRLYIDYKADYGNRNSGVNIEVVTY